MQRTAFAFVLVCDLAAACASPASFDVERAGYSLDGNPEANLTWIHPLGSGDGTDEARVAYEDGQGDGYVDYKLYIDVIPSPPPLDSCLASDPNTCYDLSRQERYYAYPAQTAAFTAENAGSQRIRVFYDMSIGCSPIGLLAGSAPEPYAIDSIVLEPWETRRVEPQCDFLDYSPTAVVIDITQQAEP